MTAAAFQATFADWKLIKTRKCVQIVFEVPLEAADAAYKVLGGMPDPSTSVWFGIAKLQPTKGGAGNAQMNNETPRQETRTGGARSWSELPYSQQAALACNDGVFRAYLNETYGYRLEGPNEAAEAVREICDVASRADIKPSTPAGAKWAEMWINYGYWKLADQVSA
jgi:hypothetical protein